MNHIISYLQRRKIGIYSYSVINSNVLLTWGTSFGSQNKATKDENHSEFTIYLPQSPVNVISYELMSNTIDVFPCKWDILVSHDNSTWKTIHTNDEPLCDIEDQINIYSASKKCNVSKVKRYNVPK